MYLYFGFWPAEVSCFHVHRMAGQGILKPTGLLSRCLGLPHLHSWVLAMRMCPVKLKDCAHRTGNF